MWLLHWEACRSVEEMRMLSRRSVCLSVCVSVLYTERQKEGECCWTFFLFLSVSVCLSFTLRGRQKCRRKENAAKKVCLSVCPFLAALYIPHHIIYDVDNGTACPATGWPNRFITKMKSLKRGRPSLSIHLASDSRRVASSTVFAIHNSSAFAVRFSRSAIFFISEVALLWKKDYLRKTTCDWLCDYDAAFVKLLWPLFYICSSDFIHL